MPNSQVVQITSIEPAQFILPMVAQTAEHHQLELEVAEATKFCAPFCGNEYFTQEIRIVSKSNCPPTSCFDQCISEIETIVEQKLADSYIETPQPAIQSSFPVLDQ